MFDRDAREVADTGGPTWSIAYALECALLELWSSLNVRPAVVLGQGPGKIAAARAAGMIGLEDGVRLAFALGESIESATLDALRELLRGISILPPAIGFVCDGTEFPRNSAEIARTTEFWLGKAPESSRPETSVGAPEGVDVDAVIEVGTAADNMRSDCGEGFAAAAARAYEAGIPLRFEGLFAGETRRRISVPRYPFQRKRFWMDC